MGSAEEEVTADGLHYVTMGRADRPGLTLLHGFMGCSDDWDTLADSLGDDARCVAVDLPGHGRSVRLDAPDLYTVPGLLKALTELLDREGIAASAVAGYSMGARLALQWALGAPGRIRGLLLESGSPGLRTEDERQRRQSDDDALAGRIAAGGLQEALRSWYEQGVFASLAAKPALRSQLIAKRLLNDPAELARALRGLGVGQQPNLWPELSRLRCPIHAVTGTDDSKYCAVARQLAQPPVNAVWTCVPGAGHIVHAEQPDIFAHIVRRFLRSLPSGQSED